MTDPYPNSVVAVGSWVHHAAQPGGDGLDAHRPGGPRPRHRPARRVLRRAGPRRRRPDHHRRVRARTAPAGCCRSPRSWLSSSEARRHRRITDAVHDEGGKILLQILHAGRYAYHPFSVSASAIKAPINPFRPRALTECRRHHRRLRPLRGAGPRSRVRRCRDHGQRGLSAQPVPGAAHQQAHRRVGRHAREAPALPGRDRAPHPRGRRRRTSSSATGCRWPTTSRTARAGTRSSRWQPKSRRPARRSSTPASAGTRRGCRRSSPRCPTARSSTSAARWPSTSSIPVVASNRINMPQAAEQILADTHVQLISMARPLLSRPGLGRQGRRPTPPTRSTPASPATRPAWTTRSCTRRCRVCSTRAPATRPTWCSRPTRRTRRIAVVGAGPAGSGRRGDRRRSAATTSRCSRPAMSIGGQFDMARRIPGKEEFSETIRYYTRDARQARRRRAAEHPRRRRGAGRLRRGGAGHRRRAADARHPRHRPSDGAVLRRGDHGQAGRQDGGRRRRRRHRFRRQRVPGAPTSRRR